MSFIKGLLFIVIALIVLDALRLTSRRLRGVRKILRLKKECGAKIRFYRFPLSSFIWLSKKPDASVELGNKIYLLRFINGKNRFKYLHFASEEYFVTYSKAIFTLSGFFNVGKRYKISENSGFSTTSFRSVKILPRLEIPDEIKIYSQKSEKMVVPVLIFNPTPHEITYIVEKKTSVKAGYFGDAMFDSLLFSAGTFYTFADREKRAEDNHEKSILLSTETSFR